MPTVEELKNSYTEYYNLLVEKGFKFTQNGNLSWEIKHKTIEMEAIPGDLTAQLIDYYIYSITPDEENIYTVQFDDTDCTWKTESEKVIYGYENDELMLPTGDNISKDGYYLAGWKKEGAEDSEKSNKYTVKAEDADGSKVIKLVPVWSSIGVKVNEGTGSSAYNKGDTVTITANKIEGKIFTGWTVKSGNVEFDTTKETATFTMGDESVEVTVNYETIKNNVKFLNEDGTQIGETQTVEYGKGAKAPDNPVKEGYTFKNWDKDFSKVTSDIEVKPVFEINKYKVKVNGEEQEVEYGKDVVMPKQNPSKEGYTFKGWNGQTTNIKADGEVTPIFVKNEEIKPGSDTPADSGEKDNALILMLLSSSILGAYGIRKKIRKVN